MVEYQIVALIVVGSTPTIYQQLQKSFLFFFTFLWCLLAYKNTFIAFAVINKVYQFYRKL